jgi:hypothetical protein
MVRRHVDKCEDSCPREDILHNTVYIRKKKGKEKDGKRKHSTNPTLIVWYEVQSNICHVMITRCGLFGEGRGRKCLTGLRGEKKTRRGKPGHILYESENLSFARRTKGGRTSQV